MFTFFFLVLRSVLLVPLNLVKPLLGFRLRVYFICALGRWGFFSFAFPRKTEDKRDASLAGMQRSGDFWKTGQGAAAAAARRHLGCCLLSLLLSSPFYFFTLFARPYFTSLSVHRRSSREKICHKYASERTKANVKKKITRQVEYSFQKFLALHKQTKRDPKIKVGIPRKLNVWQD